MNVKIYPCAPAGRIQAPPSKSYAHRLMICAALAEGKSVIKGISKSEDMNATLDCIKALGAAYSLSKDSVSIIPKAMPQAENAVFGCRESGSTLRFFIPLALINAESAVFTGTERLMERGIGVYEALFAEKGISVEKTRGSLKFTGRLRPGSYTIRGDISSQFVSGLLFALPLLDGESVLKVLPPVESRKYIDITIDAMRSFGVTVSEDETNTFVIAGNQKYSCGDISVEGDWSNAAALYGLNALGAKLEIYGLNHESIQGDMVCLDILKQLETPGAVIDLSGCPDLGPVMFAVAAAKHGAVFTGTRRLRIKESDRAQAMADELKKFGIRTIVEENRVTVVPGRLEKPQEKLSAHNDHRIVMAMTLLSTLTGGETEGAEAIRKSYPDFFDVLKSLGLEMEHGV